MVIALGKYITSHGPRTLCDGPETPTQWKSVTNLPVDQLTEVGARDANASKKMVFSRSLAAGP